MGAEVETYICQLSRETHSINTPTLKIGGIPVLLEEMEWPVCRNCGQPMDFLAQIPLSEPIAFFSNQVVAYVFMCPGRFDGRGWLQCWTWDAFAGANMVILQSWQGRTVAPVATAAYPDYSITLKQVKEPLVDRADYSIDWDLREAVSESTKIGGVPAWLQSNDTPRCPKCGETMRFVAQLNAELDGPLPTDPSEWNDEKYKLLEFGADGLGYLFICDKAAGAHGAAFLWQTT